MFTNLRYKIVVASILLISCGGVSAGNNHKAPKATAEEKTMQFWDMPLLKKEFTDTAPVKLSDDLDVGKLSVDGGDKTPILQFAKQLAGNKHGKYDSLLISHKGKLVFESYYKRGRIDLPHFQFSATKGYTSLMLARAVQLGYLTMDDLHKPLMNFFKDLDTSKLAVGTENITLHQALTMRSGLRFSDEQLKEFRENREKFSGIAEVQAFLELTEPVTKESQVFKYQGVDPILVMHVLDAVVPGTAKDFVEKEFFNKLGIVNYKWALDPKNLPVADSGIDLTSRDMVKIGEMLVNKGKWEDKQFLSQEYLAAAFGSVTKATESWHPENFSYGYLWYHANMAFDNKNYGVNLTWGSGGNRIIVVNELDLVIAITGYDREDKVFEPLIEAILPTFIKG